MPKPRRTSNGTTASPEIVTGIASPLNHRASFLVRIAQLRSFDEFHRHFAGLGVTPAGFSVLAIVAANPGIRPGAIAEELCIKPSNVAALVNGLVAQGYVRRTPDATELRANLLTMTDAGAKAWREMERALEATDAGFLAGLDAAERRQFLALLRKLLHR